MRDPPTECRLSQRARARARDRARELAAGWVPALELRAGASTRRRVQGLTCRSWRSCRRTSTSTRATTR